MPDISSVTGISSFIDFIGSFFIYVLHIIKTMWLFVINLFNPKYYYDIFSHLPHPFSTILSTLIGFICILLLLKLLSVILSSIKGGS